MVGGDKNLVIPEDSPGRLAETQLTQLADFLIGSVDFLAARIEQIEEERRITKTPALVGPSSQHPEGPSSPAAADAEISPDGFVAKTLTQLTGSLNSLAARMDEMENHMGSRPKIMEPAAATQDRRMEEDRPFEDLSVRPLTGLSDPFEAEHQPDGGRRRFSDAPVDLD